MAAFIWLHGIGLNTPSSFIYDLYGSGTLFAPVNVSGYSLIRHKRYVRMVVNIEI